MKEQGRLPGTWPAMHYSMAHPGQEGLWSGTCVLCISDDPDGAELLLGPILRPTGCEVRYASMGTELDLDGVAYQMVMIEMSSRSERSFYLVAQVRSATSAPIMLLLHGPAREEVVRGFAAGADAYVVAPFDQRELLVRGAALIRRHRRTLHEI